MSKKCDKLSSFAIKSLVCQEADEFIADLPVLLRGQEVGEIVLLSYYQNMLDKNHILYHKDFNRLLWKVVILKRFS